MTSEVDRSHLPIRRPTFAGVVNRTLDGSQPDWNLIGHPTPPRGRARTCCWCSSTTPGSATRARSAARSTRRTTPGSRGWGALQPVPRHRAVLADAGGAADRAEQPRRGVRLRRRVRRRLPGLLGDPAPRLRAAAPDPAGQRLQHRGLRQVAPHPRRPAGSGRAVRPVAERLGLRLLLRLPRRRREPVGPVPRREPEDHRHARRSTTTRRTRTTSRTRWPTAPSSGCTGSAPRTRTSRSSPTSRPAAATPRTTWPRSGPTSTRASSTRAGTSSARRRSPARRSSASSPPTPS